MRKILLILIFSFITPHLISFSQSNQSWKWLWPQPQGNTLKYSKIWNNTNWYAAGDNGTFMKTTNAGMNWIFHHQTSELNSNGSMPSLNDVVFIDQNTGYFAFDNGKLYKTTNAGETFNRVNSFPQVSSIIDLFAENSNLFYATASGVSSIFRTTNGGLTWTNINFISIPIKIYTNNQLFLVVSGNSIYRSTNNGLNWNVVLNVSSPVTVLNFIDQNIGYVLGQDGLFRYTTNGGTSWNGSNLNTFDFNNIFAENINSALINESFETINFPPAGWRRVNIYGTNYWDRSTIQSHTGSASAFINYQSNNGNDWLITPSRYITTSDSISFWIRKNLLQAYPPDSLIIKIAVSDSAISSFIYPLIKIDVANLPGNIWHRYSASLSQFAGNNIFVGFHHTDSGGNGCYLDDVKIGNNNLNYSELYATTYEGKLFKTTNNGINWIEINFQDPFQVVSNYPLHVDKNNSMIMLSGYKGLLNYSSNNSNSWSALTKMFSMNTFMDIWCNSTQSKIIAVGSQLNQYVISNIIYSADGGLNWNNALTNTWGNFNSISMVNDNTGYSAGSGIGAYPILRKTTNSGFTWDSIPLMNQNGLTQIHHLEFIDQFTGWMFGTNCTIMKTTNSGINWNLQYQNNNLVSIASDMLNNNYGIFCGYNNVILTTNSGLNWITQNVAGNINWRSAKYTTNNTCYIAGDNSSGLSAAFYKTTNNGLNWNSVNVPFSNGVWSVDALNNNNIMIGSTTGLTASSTDGGANWIMERTGTDAVTSIRLISIDTVFLTSHGGILKLNNGLSGNINYTDLIPTEHKLYQNYPNPFNPETTIKFSLPSSGNISLKIFDINGRHVTTLIDNFDLNKGTFEIKLDGSRYSSGVYFYSLIIDNSLFFTKKLIILK